MNVYDLIIVGTGPAGLGAAARAHYHKLKYLVLEQGELANAIKTAYSRGKHVMDQPPSLPIYEKFFPFKAGNRDEVLGIWQAYATAQCLNKHIEYQTKVTGIVQQEQGDVFTVQTTKGDYIATRVILAIGKLGTPRKLGVPPRVVPGEELDHVFYNLADAAAYSEKNILVVGAGDSAAEVAIELANANNKVTIANRSPMFRRMNASLSRAIGEKIPGGHITVHHNATVEKIVPGAAFLQLPGRIERVNADAVFIKIGAEVPRRFLETCGVTFPNADPSAPPMLDDTYQVQAVRGLYLIGSVTGEDLIKYALNQGYEVIERLLGNPVVLYDEEMLRDDKLKDIRGASVEGKLRHIQSRVPLLRDASSRRLRKPAQFSSVRRVAKHQVIFPEEQFSTTLYVIVEGSVTLTSRDAPTSGVVLNQGEFFGEMALLSDRPRAATAIANEASLLIEIPRRNILDLAQAEPSVQQHLEEAYTLRTIQRYLFPDLSFDAVRPLAAEAELQSFQQNKIIFQCKRGKDEETVYMIRSGSVSMSGTNVQRREYLLLYLHSGDYVDYVGGGDMDLPNVVDGLQAVTATAATRCEVICIPKSTLLTFVSKHPDLPARIQDKANERILAIAQLWTQTGGLANG